MKLDVPKCTHAFAPVGLNCSEYLPRGLKVKDVVQFQAVYCSLVKPGPIQPRQLEIQFGQCAPKATMHRHLTHEAMKDYRDYVRA